MMNRKTIYLALLLTLPLCLAGQGRGAWWRAVSAAPAVSADTSFITRWNLATAGSGATQLTFSVAVAGTVGYQWEEVSPGSASGSGTFSASPLTITGLPSGAIIRLKINPTNFQRIIIGNGTDRSRLVDIEQWGVTAWTSMLNAFFGCNNLQANLSATDIPDISGVTSAQNIFRGCSLLNEPFNPWDVSNITSILGFFYQATAYNQSLSTWDVRSATTMNAMFFVASGFNQDIGMWRPVSCTDFASFMAGKTAANYSAANLAAIFSGWPQDTLANSITTTFNTIKYAASGAAGYNFLTGTSATVSVSNATNNGGLIQITTSAAHGRTSGDFVFIDGVGGVPNSFGGRTITVIDATNFTIDGSVFAGAYTSGGTVRTGRGWTITTGGVE